jgi:hypothetical protein
MPGWCPETIPAANPEASVYLSVEWHLAVWLIAKHNEQDYVGEALLCVVSFWVSLG